MELICCHSRGAVVARQSTASLQQGFAIQGASQVSDSIDVMLQPLLGRSCFGLNIARLVRDIDQTLLVTAAAPVSPCWVMEPCY